MRPDRWSQIEGLFLQAIELPAHERERFLGDVCHGDESLRRELNSLLACDIPETPLVNGSFLPPNSVLTEVSSPALSDQASQRIGPYRLLRLLGHGGMGSVHLAVRDDDHYRKEVAIKLLKRGMDTDLMLHRFRQERQILADLEHPFIARLLDGGATDDGLPYFVMEYVDGSSITSYCAQHQLELRERLRLFRLVCEAVQYAHQHLVIHRDLKPGNILITQERIPKLLDFGIAKLMDPERGAELPTLTGVGQRMLTPDYASPEQFLGQTISTASDIYSLGAVLYELLTGQRPHRFEFDSLAAMEKAICEVEPDKPSTAVVRGSQDPPRLRRQRSRQLSGDLDNIILTALRKEPQRRYTSAAELSEDLRRHMEGLPVTARDDRLTYRMGKFIRRHKLGVVAAGLIVASLAGGIVSTTYQARRAERRFQVARQLANSVLFDLHDKVEELPGSTPVRAAMVQTVVRYLDSLAQDSAGNPDLDLEIGKAYMRVAADEGHPRKSSLGQMVVAIGHYQKALRIFERLSTRPETRADALLNLTGAHIEVASVEEVLGHPVAVMDHMRKAAAIIEEAEAAQGPQFHPSMLASFYVRMGTIEGSRGDSTAELSNLRKATEIAQKWAAASPSAEALTSLRDAYTQLANAQAHAGDLYSARDAFTTSLRIAKQLDDRVDATQLQRYGTLLIHHVYGDLLGASDDPNLGEFAEALSHYRTAAAVGEVATAEDLKDVHARRNLAGSYRRIGLLLLSSKPDQALSYYQKAVAISTQLAKSEPRNIHYQSALADGCLGIGQALHRLGRRTEALENLARTLELQKAIEAAAPNQLWLLRTTSRAYMVMGNVLLDQGEAKRALVNYREGLAATDRALQQYNSSLHHSLDRADILEAMGAYYSAMASRKGVGPSQRAELKTEAQSWYRKSLAIWQDWRARNMARPYAERRIRYATTALTTIERL